MAYSIKTASFDDIERIEKLYAHARSFMQSTGNPDQWGDVYPPRELIRQNIADGTLYLITEQGSIHGVFYFAIEEDPTYGEIYDGAWHSEEPYGVIHRIAGDGSGGLVREAMEFALTKISYLRMDTHRDNKVMQHVLKKNGFRECGVIYVEEDFPMIAFDFILIFN